MCSLQEHIEREIREREQQAADRAAFLCHETKDEE